MSVRMVALSCPCCCFLPVHAAVAATSGRPVLLLLFVVALLCARVAAAYCAHVSYSCSCSENTTEPWVRRAGTGGRQKALWRCSLLPGSTCTPPGSELAWTWTPPPLQLLPVYIIYFVEEEYGNLNNITCDAMSLQ